MPYRSGSRSRHSSPRRERDPHASSRFSPSRPPSWLFATGKHAAATMICEQHRLLEVVSPMTGTDDGRKWSTRRLSLAGIVGVLLALTVTALVVSDNAILLTVDQWTNSSTDQWARGAGWPVEIARWIGLATGPMLSVVYTLVAVVGFALARKNRWAVLLAGAGLAGVTIAELFKITISRTRPPGASLYVSDLDKSFPSGHATAGIYLYVCLAIVVIILARSHDRPRLQRLGFVLFGFGILIGISRIILGVHWLSDVVAGWMFGAATLLIALALTHPEYEDSPGPSTDPDRSQMLE